MKPRCTNTKAEALMLVGDLLDMHGRRQAAQRWWQWAINLRVRHARRREAERLGR